MVDLGDGVVKVLQDFIKVVDKIPGSPFGGTTTPFADKVTGAIVNAHLELFAQRFPFDVWVTVKGHHEWVRHDSKCVNGRWEVQEVRGSEKDHFVEEKNIGTIWGGDRKTREKELSDILMKFARNRKIE